MNPRQALRRSLLLACAWLGGAVGASAAAPEAPVAAVAPAPAGAAAAEAANDTAERARIAVERREVENRFAAEQRACRQRFLVTECLEAARADRRLALSRLQHQLIVLDDTRRRARAAERLQAIQTRQREQDQRTAPRVTPLPRQPDATPPRAPSAGATSGAAPRRPPAVHTPALRPSAAAASAASAAAAEARRHEADFAARQQAIQAHRQAVTARNQGLDAKRPAAASLPTPEPVAAASAPGKAPAKPASR